MPQRSLKQLGWSWGGGELSQPTFVSHYFRCIKMLHYALRALCGRGVNVAKDDVHTAAGAAEVNYGDVHFSHSAARCLRALCGRGVTNVSLKRNVTCK